MKFVETSELKQGMRLARAIYNKQGVLLFERDSKLSQGAIESVKKFGLLGVYILEPAEPLPPMSKEDIESEQFQTMTVFAIQNELENMIKVKRQSKFQGIVASVIKKYGHLNGPVNFYQNLRSKNDYVSRHILNTAILVTMITHVMNVRVDEQLQAVTAALAHDIGKLQLDGEVLFGKSVSEVENELIYKTQIEGLDVLETVFGEGRMIKRICKQSVYAQHEFALYGKVDSDMKMLPSAQILMVANRFDEMTAMNLRGESESEVKAIKEFLDNPQVYNPKVVRALIDAVKILFPGVSVELSTGEKALVLTENKEDILRPTVLCFKDNSILDLSAKENHDIEIMDVMKTLDNRYIMNEEALKAVGVQ